jgi:3',5'-cyclic AMP phosphodiesterase CpdA
VPTPGNHEYAKLDDKDAAAPTVLSMQWRPQFTLPEHGPAELAETCYWFDYQGTRIVALDSNRLHEEQVPWLRAVLSKNPQRWTVLTFHHPIFSPANDRDNPKLRALWKPLIDEFKVDLVLTGHDHTYARSGDMAGSGARRRDQHGQGLQPSLRPGRGHGVCRVGERTENV